MNAWYSLGLPLLSMPASSHDNATDVLLSVGGLLGKEVQLDEFLHTLMDRVAAVLQADRGTLYLLDSARGELFSRAAHLPELKQIRLKLGQGVAGEVAQTGKLVNYPPPGGAPVAGHAYFGDIDRLTGYSTHSLLAVPLRDKRGEIFGVLQVLNRRGASRFSPEDEGLLSATAQELGQALEATSLYAELRRAKDQPHAPVGYFFNHIIGESAAMQAAYRLVQKAAPTEATVLLRGESGTGKELFARAVHVNSTRRSKPFVKVDCAALPAALIENELFGHERGAFTGADHRVEGKFEVAQGGTVFIDELGELPLSVQGKLLRVLQDRELERVGGTQTVRVDVRIVTATHRDLTALVKTGQFREDLYYRIKVVQVNLPTLRDRGAEDIERLARHFLAVAAKKHKQGRVPKLSAAALSRLREYRWPGNVRELENCIESAVVLCDEEIEEDALPLPGREAVARATGEYPAVTLGLQEMPAVQLQSSDTERDIPQVATLAEVEKRHILHVLELAHGNRSAAAKLLGIGRNTMGRKLKEYGLEGE